MFYQVQNSVTTVGHKLCAVLVALGFKPFGLLKIASRQQKLPVHLSLFQVLGHSDFINKVVMILPQLAAPGPPGEHKVTLELDGSCNHSCMSGVYRRVSSQLKTPEQNPPDVEQQLLH